MTKYPIPAKWRTATPKVTLCIANVCTPGIDWRGCPKSCIIHDLERLYPEKWSIFSHLMDLHLNFYEGLDASDITRQVEQAFKKETELRKALNQMSDPVESPIPPKCRPFNFHDALSGAPVITRDGTKVDSVILAPAGVEAPYKLIAIWGGVPHLYTSEGNYHTERKVTPHDLFMVIPTETRWVNVYKIPTDDTVHSTRNSADTAAGRDRIACVEVTFEHGHGL